MEAADPPVLLSYQIAENSLGIVVCAPSHVAAGGTDNPGQTVPILPTLIAEGWTPVLPDHKGPSLGLLRAGRRDHITTDELATADAALDRGRRPAR